MFIGIALSLNSLAQEKCDYDPSRKEKKQYKEALSYVTNGSYYQATKILLRLTSDAPEYIDAWWVLGDINMRIMNRSANKEVAINAFDEVIRLCPSHKDYYAYYYSANLNFGEQNYAKAHKLYEKFLNADSDRILEKHFDIAVRYSQLAKLYDKLYKNEVPFEPKLLKGISTSDDEYLVTISPDGEFAYFTRRMQRQQNSRVRTYGQSGTVERFCFSQRINGMFEKGKPLEYPFNQTNNEGSSTVTIDNKKLYYTSCFMRPNQYYDCDIYVAENVDGYWEKQRALGPNVNNSNSWESMPTVTSDGKTLYFTSDREGGMGGYDIYRCRMDENGEWGPATNMGKAINTAGNEKSPFIHTDSQTLYFSSANWEEKDNQGNYIKTHYGHSGLGGYDIFYTRIGDENAWVEPKNIGYPINSENDDLGFFVSTDGETGYFASSKLNEDGVWNVYYFELYKEARPKKVLFLKGQLKDEETGQAMTEAKIYLKNTKSKEVIEIDVDDETGKYVATAIFENDYTLTIKRDDYAYVTKYISRHNDAFKEPIKLDVEIKPIKIGSTYEIEDIYFDTDSDKLRKQSYEVLDEFVKFMNENPNLKIEIQGHTDNVGKYEYNMELSDNRAKSVYQALINRGVLKSRLTYKGYGETKPVATNSNEEGRQKNRRTEFLIIEN